MIAAALERKVGTLVLSSKPIHRVDEEQKLKVWCEVIRDKGISLLGWTDVQRQWQARVMSLKSWRIGEAWPDVSDEALLQTVDVWLTPFLTGISRLSELQRLDWSGILFTLPPWELASRMDVLAPTRIQVPSGSNIQVHYFTDGRPPIMEVRLQEMFGLVETPSINEGRTSILLHLLSPGYKPVQVTQDLKSFWHTTYHEVRKELRMRYPKHHWPEDPWTAEAVRGVKKKTS
jgi:ATP-dependent helicase HrpB